MARASLSIGPGLIAGIRGKGPIELREIVLSEPLVQLIFYEDGSSNLPDFPEGDGSEGGLEIWIARLTVEEGLFIVDEREAPLDFSVRELSASLRQTGETSYVARADSSEATIVLPESNPLSARLAVEAEIAGGGIEIRDARVEGTHLTASASGSFRDDVLSLELSGDLDAAFLEEAGWVERDPAEPDAAVLEGTASLAGKFRLTESIWEIDGSFESPRLSFGEFALSEIEGTVGGGSQKLLVAVRKGSFEGGRAEAAIGIDLTLEEPAVFVQAMIAGFDLATYLESLDVPVSGIEGVVEAEGLYSFTASAPEAGDGLFSVAVEPPGSLGPDEAGEAADDDSPAAPGSLPLTGGLEVRLAEGLLTFEDTGLSAPDQRIEISGEVVLETLATAVDFRLETEDPRAILRALPDLYDEDGNLIWEPTEGRGELSGTASVEGEVYSAELQFDLESVVLAGAEVPSLEGNLKIDNAAVQSLYVEALRGEERMVLTGAFPLEQGPAGLEAPPFRFDLESDGWDVADAGPFLPFDMPPLYGSFYGSFRMWGDLEAPEGELQARVVDLRYDDLELPGELEGPIRFDVEEVELGPIRYLSEAGDVEFAGTMDLVDETMEMNLVSSPLSLTSEPFDSMIAGDLSGSIDLAATIGGTFESPEIDASVTGVGLVLDGNPLGENGTSDLDISLASGELDVSGSLLGLISAEGGGAFTEETTDVAVAIGSDRLRELTLIALGQAPETLEGSFGGTFTLSRIGEALEGRIVIGHVTLANELSRLSNVEPVVVVFDERGGFLELLYLREEGTGSELIVVGDLGGAAQEMNLFIDSNIDASWISLYLPDADLSGQLQILASVRGEPSDPVIDGQAQISGGRLILEGFPHAVEGIEGLAFLYPDRIVIDAGRRSIRSWRGPGRGHRAIWATTISSTRSGFSAPTWTSAIRRTGRFARMPCSPSPATRSSVGSTGVSMSSALRS